MPRRGDCYTRSQPPRDITIEHLIRLVEKLTKEIQELKLQQKQPTKNLEEVKQFKDQYFIENSEEVEEKNSIYLWKIRDFCKLRDVGEELQKMHPKKFFYIQSRPFKTIDNYYIVLLLYPNGYKGQLNKCLSLFFALVDHEEYKNIKPSWPFKLNARLGIIDQDKDKCHKRAIANMDSSQKSLFVQPKESRNGSFGTLNLLSLSTLDKIPGLTRDGVHIQLELSTGMFLMS